MDISLDDLPNVTFPCFVLQNYCEVHVKHSLKKSLKNHAVMKESFSLPFVPQAMEQHSETSRKDVRQIFAKFFD